MTFMSFINKNQSQNEINYCKKKKKNKEKQIKNTFKFLIQLKENQATRTLLTNEL